LAPLPSLQEVRIHYQSAATKENDCRQLLKELETVEEKSNPVLGGYRASAMMMMANHVFNPFKKLSYFNDGKALLERSIAADGQNVELRFLRFAAQSECPSFLNYNSQVDADKQLLLNSLSQIKDQQLKKMLCDFLSNSKQLSRSEKEMVHHQHNQ
jgi:hypothetical protein